MNYNKIHMLTGHSTKEDVYEQLFLDALVCFEKIEIANKKILDIGTGAGLPGVPLKINEPTIDLFLLETMGKRVKFLESLKQIGIDATIIHARAEEVANDFNNAFDIVTLRAVKETRIALEFMARFAKIGGLLVLPKGQKASEEKDTATTAEKTLGLQYLKTVVKTLPSGRTNNVLIYKKVSETPIKYPRNFSQISKKPL